MKNSKIVVTFQPRGKAIEAIPGTILTAVAQEAGIHIPTFCGSKSKCGKCKVKLLGKNISYTIEEEKILSPDEKKQGIHLACQIRVNTNLIVEVLNEEKVETTAFLTYDIANNFEIDDHLKKYFLELSEPNIENLIDDLSNLETKLGFTRQRLNMPLPVLQNLSNFLRKNQFNLTIALDNNRVICVETGDTSQRLYGIAIDLGTTTIVGSLINLPSGRLMATSARTNPQATYGADVVSRVNYATSEPGGLVKLQNLVIKSINEIIEDLCENANTKFREIYEVSLAGNTIMNHLFLGVNPQYIAEAPYTPTFTKSQKVIAEELGLTMLPRGPVSTLPNISGYVGGDITGFILACNLNTCDKITLGINIGTNGEIILGNKDRLLCCATAAGPAFEGGHISSGMRAMQGAIDKFSIKNDQINFHVIDDTEPKGICGTGLIDIVAELVRVGIISETGLIISCDEFSGSEHLKNRIKSVDNGNAFIVSHEDKSKSCQEILLKQQDIRELQLAKSAIAAGVAVMMKELNITDEQIEEVLIAGAFGSFLNKQSAHTIKLLPDVPIEKIKFVGNAASMGAKKFLLSNNARQEAQKITEQVEYIELSTRLDFQGLFAEKMFF